MLLRLVVVLNTEIDRGTAVLLLLLVLRRVVPYLLLLLLTVRVCIKSAEGLLLDSAVGGMG